MSERHKYVNLFLPKYALDSNPPASTSQVLRLQYAPPCLALLLFLKAGWLFYLSFVLGLYIWWFLPGSNFRHCFSLFSDVALPVWCKEDISVRTSKTHSEGRGPEKPRNTKPPTAGAAVWPGLYFSVPAAVGRVSPHGIAEPLCCSLNVCPGFPVVWLCATEFPC